MQLNKEITKCNLALSWINIEDISLNSKKYYNKSGYDYSSSWIWVFIWEYRSKVPYRFLITVIPLWFSPSIICCLSECVCVCSFTKEHKYQVLQQLQKGESPLKLLVQLGISWKSINHNKIYGIKIEDSILMEMLTNRKEWL